MEQLIKQWLSGLKTPVKTSPLEQMADAKLMQKWESAQLKLMIDFPGKPMPAVHIIRNAKALGNLPGHAFSMPAGEALPAGIYLTEEYLQRLTPGEATAVLLHESGHQLRDHGERTKDAQGKYGFGGPYIAERRKMECEADHFVIHYSDAPTTEVMADFGNAMAKLHGNGKLYTQASPESHHPADVERVQRLANEALKEYKPGQLLFDRQCNISGVAPSPTPAPETSSQRQR